MNNDSPERSLRGPCSQQDDQDLFADVKAADLIYDLSRWCIEGEYFQLGPSGSNLLDDIRAADAVNAIRARSNEPDEQRDQMAVQADPIVLKWVKGFGWVRSGIPVVAPRKAIRIGPPIEQPRALSDGACRSVGPFAVSTTVYARWMLPQGPAPPILKADG